jgi:hypothetical protein
VIAIVYVLRSLVGAIRHAAKSEDFRGIFAAAIFLVLLGTVTYSLSEGWSVVDSFYFAVCTLSTSNVADPHLTLSGEPIKIFTAFYVLVGIGILVETLRQIGLGYVAMLHSEHGVVEHVRRRHRGDPPETPSSAG